MKKILFIDRDGTIIKEVPPLYRVDSFEKLSFYPHVFEWLGKIAREMDYELVMVTNQDGLGTEIFPQEKFQPVHDLIMKTFEGEGIHFSAVLIDKTFPEENKNTRKPATGMLTSYLSDPGYDISNSFVIGDRITDMQLAKNLKCKGIWLKNNPTLGAAEVNNTEVELKQDTIVLDTKEWKDVYNWLREQREKEKLC